MHIQHLKNLAFLQHSSGRTSEFPGGRFEATTSRGGPDDLYSNGRRRDNFNRPDGIGISKPALLFVPLDLSQLKLSFEPNQVVGGNVENAPRSARAIQHCEAAIALAYFFRFTERPHGQINPKNVIYSDAALKDKTEYREGPAVTLISLLSGIESNLPKLPVFISNEQLVRGLELFLASFNSIEQAGAIASRYRKEEPAPPLATEISVESISRVYFELTKCFLASIHKDDLINLNVDEANKGQKPWREVCANLSAELEQSAKNDSTYKICKVLLEAGANAKPYPQN